MSKYVKSYGPRLQGGLAAETLAVGDLVNLSAAGTWELADADGAAGLRIATGVCTMAAVVTGITEVCSRAIIGGGTGLTVGAPLYLSATAGAPTETAPTGAFHTIQCVGYNLNATTQVFNIAPQAYLRPS